MDTIQYKAGYKYQLYRDFKIRLDRVPDGEIFSGRFIHLSETGLLTINNGYSWDGPSGPTVDSKNFMRGSLVHDALYQMIRRGQLPKRWWREYADEVLREICLEDGMCSIRAWYVYKSVRAFGSGAVQKPKEVITAP
jgi:hypothetical protein